MDFLIEKIDKHLAKKMHLKIESKDAKSYLAMKRLVECDWVGEKHLRKEAAECFKQLTECDDKLAIQFMKKLKEACKTISEDVVLMYMTNQDIDMLPRRAGGTTEEDEE
jgi:hypothetical protein